MFTTFCTQCLLLSCEREGKSREEKRSMSFCLVSVSMCVFQDNHTKITYYFWRLNKSVRARSVFLVFMCIWGPVILGTRPRSNNSRLSVAKQASVLSGCLSLKYVTQCSWDIRYKNTAFQHTAWDNYCGVKQGILLYTDLCNFSHQYSCFYKYTCFTWQLLQQFTKSVLATYIIHHIECATITI